MYTQCPHCLSVYQPTPLVLARSRGRLRCGVCENDFDALERLSEQPIHAAAPPVTPSSTVLRLDPEHPPEQGHLFEPARPESPTFVARETTRTAARSNGAWWAGSIALALLLGAQIVLAQRAELARDPQWRSWLQLACTHLRCSLPAWRDISALRLAARDVRPHPSVPDALMISATFRNDAPWPQAWPVLQISLSDLDGKPVALRRFEPAEYLGSAPREATLAPGQSASATLEVQDPGKQAVAFAFEFL
jgi:predicted Zn finger-like uncharacterized protein